MTTGHDDLLRAAETLASRVPEPLGPLARLAYNYRWSWSPDGHDIFATIDPARWERCGENPVRLLQEAAPERLERAAGDGAAARAHRRARRRGARGPRAPRGRGAGDAGQPGRLLLRGVRRPQVAPGLLRRARRARRRHPQGGVRPGAAARRDRAAVPPGLLPPAHRRRRLAARVLGRHGSRAAARRAGDGSRRRAADRHRARARARGDGPDLARGRRPRPAVPARHRAAGERRRGPLDHVAALHRGARPAAGAVHPARRRRRARARGARDRPRAAASQRGPRGVHLARGGAGPRRHAGRRHRGGAQEDDLHHAHARAGGQRHVPGRPGRRGAGRR